MSEVLSRPSPAILTATQAGRARHREWGRMALLVLCGLLGVGMCAQAQESEPTRASSRI